MLNKIIFVSSLLLLTFIFSADKKKDVIFDDFESGTYDKWEIKGDVYAGQKTPFKVGDTASGYTPASFTKVNGKYVATTFYLPKMDKATGSLKSKPFTITHKYIKFVVFGGSGKDVGFRLLIDGKEVAVARGEQILKPAPVEDAFSVSKYMGKEAVLELFDNSKGGWGHAGVDNIIFSDDEGCE